MVIGPQALGLIDIKADSALNQVILLFGASYILFDGGASLRLGVLKQVWITIVAIATVGVVLGAIFGKAKAAPKWHLLHSYCGAVAAFVIASSAAAIALTVASPSRPKLCRFASQFGSL